MSTAEQARQGGGSQAPGLGPGGGSGGVPPLDGMLEAARSRRLSAALTPATPLLLTAVVLTAYLVDAIILHPGTVAPHCPIFGAGRLVHWDGAWYQYVAENGYRPLPGVQQPGAFFPLFPVLAHGVHLAIMPLSDQVAGIVVNLIAVAAAMILIDRAVAEWPALHRAALLLLLLTLPAALFYVTFYSEALFTLGVAILLFAVMRPGRLVLAPLGIIIASSDRIIGIGLVCALAAVLYFRRDHVRRSAAIGMLAASFAGLFAVIAYGALSSGDLSVFANARNGWRGPSGIGYVPYMLRHGIHATVTLVREEATFAPIPGVGPVIGSGTVPWGIGFYVDILLVPLALAAWRVRREVGVIAGVMVGATLLLGPPISQARFALVCIPAWLGGVALLSRRAWGWALIALTVAVGFGVNMYLMGQFANCQWAG